MQKEPLDNFDSETVPQLKQEIVNLKAQAINAVEIPVDCLLPLQLPGEMQQPRLYFDPKKIEILKESIRKHGVLEPLVVRPHYGSERLYEIISGERRWRCCQALRIMFVPCIVRPMSDMMALETAIIAHLLNEEISAIEQTESILSLLSLQLNLTYDQVRTLLYQIKNSRTRGKGLSPQLDQQKLETINATLAEFGMKLSSFVSNRLPLLNLAPEILAVVKAGKLSPSNALLINRQPEAWHATLIAQVIGKSKSECLQLIKSMVPPEEKPPPPKESSLQTPDPRISEQIVQRLQAIQQQPHLLELPEIISRLAQIERLLADIELLSDSTE